MSAGCSMEEGLRPQEWASSRRPWNWLAGGYGPSRPLRGLAQRGLGGRCSNQRRSPGRAPSESGEAMVVWCLLLALLLLPLGGLSVDLWHGIAVQRELQSAAEDAASAGASGINVNEYRQTGCVVLDPSSALELASANLASQAGLGPLVSANIEVAPNASDITVLLRKDVHLTLLRLVEGNRPLVVAAQATAEPAGSVSGTGCSR
jgi:hypothetical protein